MQALKRMGIAMVAACCVSSSGCAPGAGPYQGTWTLNVATTSMLAGFGGTSNAMGTAVIENDTMGADLRIITAFNSNTCTIQARRTGTTATLFTGSTAPSCMVPITGGTATLTYQNLTLTLGSDMQSFTLAASGTLSASNAGGTATVTGTFNSTGTGMRQSGSH